MHQECNDKRGKARLDGHGRAAQHPPELLPGSMIAKPEEEEQLPRRSALLVPKTAGGVVLGSTIVPGLTCHIFVGDEFLKT